MLGLLFAYLLVALTPQSELVIVKEGTQDYHRPGCEVIRDGRGVLAMTRAQAESRAYKPHPACDPEKPPPPADPPASSTSGASPKKPPAAVSVFVDATGKRYHREGCKQLGKAPRKVALEEAGKKYWPCPVCRPPIRPRKR
jgi:hypothetical protein